MKNLLLIFTLIIFATSCDKDEEPFLLVESPTTDEDYIVFGTYAGFCAGEQCIEIFKLTSTTLSEDRSDLYPDYRQPYIGDYELLGDEQFQKAKSILISTPPVLLTIQDTIIGMPDYADSGGIYFEYNVGITHRYWLIDQMKGNIPNQLHDFVNVIKITVENISE
jgi:hypothetical protein